MSEAWRNETIHSLRTDSPYYWEMKETEDEHRREMRYLREQERADMLADIDDDDEEEDDDLPNASDPEHW